MRIRKRTPARAASPGPSPALSPSPPPLPKEVLRVHSKEEEEEEDDDEPEEKRVILVAGDEVRQDALSFLADSKRHSVATDDGVPRAAAAEAGRCRRNDGKRWRCRNAVVPGFLFCDRHVAWSVRQRRPRADRKQSKKRNSGGGALALAPAPAKEEGEEEAEEKYVIHDGSAAPQLARRQHDEVDDGFQTGGRKRARGGGPGPAE